MERGPRLGEALLTLRDELVDSIVPVRECRALTGGPDVMTDGDTTRVAGLRNGALNQGTAIAAAGQHDAHAHPTDTDRTDRRRPRPPNRHAEGTITIGGGPSELQRLVDLLAPVDLDFAIVTPDRQIATDDVQQPGLRGFLQCRCLGTSLSPTYDLRLTGSRRRLHRWCADSGEVFCAVSQDDAGHQREQRRQARPLYAVKPRMNRACTLKLPEISTARPDVAAAASSAAPSKRSGPASPRFRRRFVWPAGRGRRPVGAL
jgi:hypothetical protein